MTKRIFKCNNCNKYTMKETCDCGNKTLFSRPVKYTPNDKFSSYKRKAKIAIYASRGLL
ncbi:ribosome biogenesis protein [Candidatus Woesearchaeota archaeon]|nr:ribosome biogenesis protein [Candidatus Woesearchaeota archaeon]